MATTKIEWADAGWNAYDWHCSKVSPGCLHCYAERDAVKRGRPSFTGSPPSWRKNADEDLRTIAAGSVVFVNNHSDTYHPGVPLADMQRVHTIAVQRPDLIFLLLTKRPEIALLQAGNLAWPDNLWLGTSVESQTFIKRIDILKLTPAKHLFISFEPLISRLDITDVYRKLERIEWAIVGGESGEIHRPFDHDWANDIREMCVRRDGIPFFYKQGSGTFPGSDRVLKSTGKMYEERPAAFGLHHLKYQVQVEQPKLF